MFVITRATTSNGNTAYHNKPKSKYTETNNTYMDVTSPNKWNTWVAEYIGRATRAEVAANCAEKEDLGYEARLKQAAGG